MAKRGIDISAHQGNINLAKLKNQIDFVIIRVGYGTSGSIDKKFNRNVSLCEELGIPYGFYWYSYALDVAGAEKEAKYFLDAIGDRIPSYGCWFDMEDADGYKKRHGMPSNSVLQDMCYVWCDIVENAGYYTGVYASESWFKNQLASPKLNKFAKWVAQWPTSNGKQKGLDVAPESRSNLTLWQFTSLGRFSGYEGGLDTNYAYAEFPNPGFDAKKDDEKESQPIIIPEPIANPEGTVLELAVKTVKGEFGDGEDRKKALGTKYDEVRKFINHIYSSNVKTLADEVIVGKYGKGEERKIILGEKYKEVQELVNKILNKYSVKKDIYKGVKIKFTGTKSYSGIVLAPWVQNDIFDVIEVSGDRIVIGKGTIITAAVNVNDCQLI